ncbi:MAG: hypothetical protein HY868_02755 [Chloroflexi bacterium]|nr:hypothetical protein [Chloroflexota bacterium]
MPAVVEPELREYLQDALETIEWSELQPIVQELGEKSQRAQLFLRAPERVESLAAQDIESLLRMISVTRRHRDQVWNVADNGAFKNALTSLLHGHEQDLGVRINQFLAETQAINQGKGVELAGELLHLSFPERYWLWSRWMYSPESRTGVLPLLLDGDKELHGDSPGQMYLRVGRAIVMVTEVEDAKWLFRGGLSTTLQDRPFAIDTFLATTYAAYLYGVTAWRLTREFHKVLPPLPRLVRRMLGLKISPQSPVASQQ